MKRPVVLLQIAGSLLLGITPVLLLPGVCPGQRASQPAKPRGSASVIARQENGVNTDFTFTNFPDQGK
jgi:hypothetical protein